MQGKQNIFSITLKYIIRVKHLSYSDQKFDFVDILPTTAVF